MTKEEREMLHQQLDLLTEQGEIHKDNPLILVEITYAMCEICKLFLEF